MPSSPEVYASPTVDRAKVITGARWRGLLQLGQQLLSLFATVALARLLSPHDIGVTAAALFILGLLGLASTTGLYAAVVRRSSIDDDYLGGVFAANSTLGLGLTAVGIVLAPVLSDLAGIGEQTLVVIAVMPLLALGTWQTVSLAILDRHLASGKVAIAGFASTTLYVVLEVGLALAGLGYWAVIIGYVGGQVVNFVLLVVLARWRPVLRWPGRVWREDGAYSLKFTLNSGLEYAAKNLDYWVVGAVLGPGALGAYYIAFVLPMMLRVRMVSIMSQLLLPVFGRLRSDPERMRRAYTSMFCMSAALSIPMMLGIAVVSPSLVPVFFGDQWRASVAPMRWIAVAAIFDFLSAGLGVAALSHGLMRRLVLGNTVRVLALSVSIPLLLSVDRSITSVAMAVLICAACGMVTNQVVVARPLGLTLAMVAKPLTAVCVAGVMMSAASWGASEYAHSLGATPLVQLSASVVTGVVVYLAVGFAVAPKDFTSYTKDVARVLAITR